MLEWILVEMLSIVEDCVGHAFIWLWCISRNHSDGGPTIANSVSNEEPPMIQGVLIRDLFLYIPFR